MWDWNGTWEWWYHDKYGNVIQQGQGKNILHQTGQQFILQNTFAPLGTNLSVIEADCCYDDVGHADGTKCLHTVTGEDAPFATVIATDYVYLAGGPGATVVTPGVYLVDGKADSESVRLNASPYAGDIAGGVVVILARKLSIGLDRRSSLQGTDVAGLITGATEEDGGGYLRVSIDPHNSSNWTFSLDSDTNRWKAASAIATFTASDALWQSNRNIFVMAHTGLVAAGSASNEVLVASMSLGDPVIVADTKSITARYTPSLKETS